MADLLNLARRQFTAQGVEAPTATARILVGGLLGRDLTRMVLGAGEPVSDAEQDRIADAIDRCCAGEPVHRILGRRDFFGIDLLVTAEVLEPRPDTEVLVEAVLAQLRRAIERHGRCRILDLGTGSGAIALAISHAMPEAEVVATDISQAALITARENAARLGLEARVRMVESDWFTAVEGRFDLIVSNPPYIRTSAIATLDANVRDFDPHQALDGGPDGLDAYRAIARGCRDHLAAGGQVAVEIGFDQMAPVRAIFEGQGFTCRIGRRDLGGCDRVLVFE